MQFKIGETDFGIDLQKSTYQLKVPKSGKAILDIEIYGDQQQYEKVTEDEESKWSWTLYPPHFYLRSFPAKKGTGDAYKATVTVDDLNDFEVAIYFMEHNDVDQVKITSDQQGFQATGIVSVFGEEYPFSIKYKKLS